MRDLEAAFGRMAEGGLWGCAETLSGPGSTLEACQPILARLPEWIARFNIRSIVDLGCGDFHWMKEAAIPGAEYDGYDVVLEIICWNRLMHGDPHTRFHHADFLEQEILRADLALVKDVFIHLPTELVVLGLSRIRKSGCSFLAATTHSGARRGQEPSPANFAPIDLELPGFGLGVPLDRVEVPRRAGNPKKYLAFWKLR